MTMHVSVANSHRIQVTDKIYARATPSGLVIDGRKSYRGESVDNRTWQTLADLRAFLALTDKWAKEAAQQRAEEKARQAAKATEPQDDDKPQPVTEAWTLQDSGATQQWVRITVRERDARHQGPQRRVRGALRRREEGRADTHGAEPGARRRGAVLRPRG